MHGFFCGVLLIVGDGEGGGRFLVGVAGGSWLPLDAASCACAAASCCSSCRILWLDCGSVESVF